MVVRQGMLSNRWKGIFRPDNGELELFDVKSDPEEKNEISGLNKEQAEKMRLMIQDWVEQCRSRAPYNISIFDDAALEKLRAMGYLR
jgi:hypothetical protein